LVVAGNNPRTLPLRAVAQSLREFGLPPEAVLGDARVSILSGTQTVDTNNNWAQTNAAPLNAAFPAVGAFPLSSASDAALLNALAPGSYTLQAGAAPLPAQPPANFVAPYGGAKGMLGTNPYSFAVPAGVNAPFLADFATSVVAAGKLRVAQAKGVPAPEGALSGAQGRPEIAP